MSFWKRRKPLAAGADAPDFRLARLDGGEVTLAGLATAHPVLIAFFKISCPVCQMTLPFLQRLHTAGTLAVYGISQNEPGDTRDFLDEFGISLPVLLDPEDGFPASNAYGITHVPTLFLIGPGMKIGRAIEGWVKAEIERLGELAGVEVIREGERVPVLRPG
ncbi:MAG: TlpA disulfide reductase family protein [Bryobacteraceae bacterium]|jgi:peroxiredoxin